MNYSLDSLKGVISWTIRGHIKEDTRSLDYGSCAHHMFGDHFGPGASGRPKGGLLESLVTGFRV